MTLARFAFFCFFFCCILQTRVLVPSSLSDPFPKNLEKDLLAGTSAIYNLEFRNAQEHLDKAVKKNADHPGAYFFQAMLTWYELTYDLLFNHNPILEKELKKRISLTIEKAGKLKEDPDTKPVGYLFLGGALGAKGWYHISKKEWISAYLAGQKGYSFLKKALSLNPDLYDTHLGIGMYEYYAATLGPVLKALSSLTVRGDKKKALMHLNMAKIHSRFVSHESTYFLWSMAIKEEDYDQAMKYVKDLRQIFPISPLFQWCEIKTLHMQGKWDKVLDLCEKHSMGTLALLSDKIFYFGGVAALNLENHAAAKLYFRKTIAQPAEFTRWQTMAHLHLGELFDLEGNREESLKEYEIVLSLPEVWNSHKVSKKRIAQPIRNLEEIRTIPVEYRQKKIEKRNHRKTNDTAD